MTTDIKKLLTRSQLDMLNQIHELRLRSERRYATRWRPYYQLPEADPQRLRDLTCMCEWLMECYKLKGNPSDLLALLNQLGCDEGILDDVAATTLSLVTGVV